ncbi:P-loop containing nucleoside triphosphate hydrolase protein [Chytriomyces sp. MP71]|nr:P-loop containing nucleoside triphosphate hydrolase protein [Chytriomyces sp. MP71]
MHRIGVSSLRRPCCHRSFSASALLCHPPSSGPVPSLTEDGDGSNGAGRTTSANFARSPNSSYRGHRTSERKGGGFVDLKCVNAVSGAGGDGSIHFFKGLINPIGPPCGGNGGKGGDVWITASKDVTSLGGLLNRYRASNGSNGDRQNMHGKDADSIEIVVPVGTIVRQVDSLQDIALAKQRMLEEAETASAMEASDHASLPDEAPLENQNQEIRQWEEGEDEEGLRDRLDAEAASALQKRREKEERQLEFIKQYFLFRKDYIPHQDRIKLLRSRIPPRLPPQPPIHLDLSTHGERHLILRGGRPGFGNPHFTSNEIKGPGIASRGEKGSSVWLELELKTIADVGLVGLPNAGKSTLLSKITNATPKIASYPFTTLNPYVGTIEYADNHAITVADIPGLVAGAHLNVGLGHEFLRHVERCNVLVYVVDLGGMDAGADWELLVEELERYKEGLSFKPSLVVGNKADLGEVAKENLGRLKRAMEAAAGVVGATGKKRDAVLVPISAKDNKNVGVALAHLRELVEATQQSTDSNGIN